MLIKRKDSSGKIISVSLTKKELKKVYDEVEIEQAREEIEQVVTELINTSSEYDLTPEEILSSEFFDEVIARYLKAKQCDERAYKFKNVKWALDGVLIKEEK